MGYGKGCESKSHGFLFVTRVLFNSVKQVVEEISGKLTQFSRP